MSEPNVYEQLAGMTIERDAALAKVAAVEALLARLDADAARSLTDWHTELVTGRIRDALAKAESAITYRWAM